jgi:hypothetical protein
MMEKQETESTSDPKSSSSVIDIQEIEGEWSNRVPFLSELWIPKYNPYDRSNNRLPTWKKEAKLWFKYKFLLQNINELMLPTAPPSTQSFHVTQSGTDWKTLSGHKRSETNVKKSSGRKEKLIKLENESITETEYSCEHPVWHPSYPYCSICVDLSKIKVEAFETQL